MFPKQKSESTAIMYSLFSHLMRVLDERTHSCILDQGKRIFQPKGHPLQHRAGYMRLANDSDEAYTTSGEALPRIRKHAGRRSRSARTRKRGKKSSRRWISSIITTPRNSHRAVIRINGKTTTSFLIRNQGLYRCNSPARFDTPFGAPSNNQVM